MFTPPHSSHLPHSPESLAALLASLTHKLTALGFSALISFLFSPGTEAVLRSIMLFLSSHSLLALIPSDMLAVDIPSWPKTFPRCLQHLREHSSRGNVILLCTRWSQGITGCSSSHYLLQGLGPPVAALQAFPFPSHLHVEMDLLLDFLHMGPPAGLGMFLLNITLQQTPHPGVYLTLLPPYLGAAPQTGPL